MRVREIAIPLYVNKYNILRYNCLNGSVSIVKLIVFPGPNDYSLPLPDRRRDSGNVIDMTCHDLTHCRFLYLMLYLDLKVPNTICLPLDHKSMYNSQQLK